MTTAREIALCPFCRSVASVHETDWCEPPEYNVFCHGCGVLTPASADRDKVVALWNRRDESALLAERRRAIEEAAKIVESSLMGCVWGTDLLPLQERYAKAIRAHASSCRGTRHD